MAKLDTERELRVGNALAAFAGLAPSTTAREWRAEPYGNGEVLVRFETLLIVPQEQFFNIYNDTEGK